MIRINENFLKLKASYLFVEIAKRVEDYQKANPDKPVIKLGIGDVTEPLPPACIEAFHKAVDEMGDRDTFRGYPPGDGYAFLREAIAKGDYASRGVDIAADEIFVSDGAKSDSANIQEIFGDDATIAVSDPVYPVYVDSNVMAGRTGLNDGGRYTGLSYIEMTPENNYVAPIPDAPSDLIYLCYPNNPTGVVATREQLQAWVDFAREHGSIILFDAAYEAFIRDDSIPHSIYEIPGARECAIELRSFSKNAGFTGVRCAYTVVPKDLKASDAAGNSHSLHALWGRRQGTKFNGVSYPVQRAAEAVYTTTGQEQVKQLTDFYMGNARLIREAMQEIGRPCVGGDNSPYVWVQTGGSSWDFFDKLLNEAGVVTTPGAGFGKCGEGHIRISAFNSRENLTKALDRIKKAFG